MREIMAGTKEGKKIIEDIVNEIKTGLKEDEFNEAMNEVSKNSSVAPETSDDIKGFGFDELFGGKTDDDSDEGYDFEDLFK